MKEQESLCDDRPLRRSDLTESDWRWLALLVEDAIVEIDDDDSWAEDDRECELARLSELQRKLQAGP